MKKDVVKPWYREPWAWLIVGPLLFVIVLGIALLTISIKYRDDVVSDDYYKEGKMLDNRFEAERVARESGLSGELELDGEAGEVRLILNQPMDSSDALSLLFSHPAKAAKDHSYQLQRFSLNGYKATLKQMLDGRWYVRVEARNGEAPDVIWRLSGEVDFDGAATLTLQ